MRSLRDQVPVDRRRRPVLDRLESISAGKLMVHFRPHSRFVGCVTVRTGCETLVLEFKPSGACLSKPFLRCPRCRRCRSHLYRQPPGGGYLCRACLRAPYLSQQVPRRHRRFARAVKIYQHLLGDRPLDMSKFPPRPKGMWRRTYERLYIEAQDALAEAG